MKEVKIIFVDVLADAGEPDAGFLIITADGKMYKGNGTASPDEITTTLTDSNFANHFLLMGS
jgi:hypothetical protein